MRKLDVLCVTIFAFLSVFAFILGYGVHELKTSAEQQNVEEVVEEPQIEILEKVKYVKSIGEYELTAYCPCERCCDKSDGITASGATATEGITIAADTSILPFGTKVIINGHEYTVEDRGGAIKGNRIDIFFADHQTALNFGRQKAEVFIVD